MKRSIFLLMICLGLIYTTCTPEKKKCIITGKVINRPQSTKLRLIKAFENIRSKSAVVIPIKDGIFTHEFNFKDIEAYELVFEDEFIEGSMKVIHFFPINGTIKMELYAKEAHEKNIILGGKENKKYSEYNKKRNKDVDSKRKAIDDKIQYLQDNNNYYSPVLKEQYKNLEGAKRQEDIQDILKVIEKLEETGEGYTHKTRILLQERDSLFIAFNNIEYEYLKDNISIPNYYSLISSISMIRYAPMYYNHNKLFELQIEYAAKYKDHPYTKYSQEVIWSLSNIKPGGFYYDFTLPDLNGKEYKLSNEVKGKYAIIDIWAPWCGPCISKIRKLKPVYEEYKDKDFTVVAVASKYRNISNVKELLVKDKYPWITLIDKPELDSKLNEHYDIINAGGCCLLIDKRGEIVLVNPTIKEITEVLKANL